MRFASRQDAGRQLGQHLRKQGVEVDLVLGLPRGGVVVAAEVARRLQRPLDVLVVRKIGHPWHREFAVGALAEPDVVIFDRGDRWRRFRRRALNWTKWWPRKLPDCASTVRTFTVPIRPCSGTKACCWWTTVWRPARRPKPPCFRPNGRGARRTTMAAPVASTGAVERLRRVADEVVTLMVDPGFEAVGQYYDEFSQTNDEEVLALLHAAALRGE